METTNPLQPNLGASQPELNKLHGFAERYKAEKATERESMKNHVTEVISDINTTFSEMARDETRSFPTPKGSEASFVVVKKIGDGDIGDNRLRMALTNNLNEELGGYLPVNLKDFSGWQEVMFDEGGKPNIIHTWGRQQIKEIISSGCTVYWGNSTELSAKGLEYSLQNNDGIESAYKNVQPILKIPHEVIQEKV
jgi:hypothetical protein